MTQQRQQLQQIARQALDICEQLERGQADTPLSDMIYAQQSALASAPLTVVLLGLTPDSLNQTLAWLYGDLFKGMVVSTESLSGYLEVTTTQAQDSNGYALGLANSQKKQFDAQEDFIQALQIEMGLSKSSIHNPFAVNLENARGMAGLKLLIPESVEALLDTPSLLNALVSQSNLLMVAAPLKYTLSREDHETIEAISANMRGFMPLLTVDELAEDVALPEIGWWEQHKLSQEQFPPKLITKHVDASLPSFLMDPTDEQRQLYLNSFFASKLSHTLSAIFDRYQQESGLLQQRQSKLQQQTRSQQQSNMNRHEQDNIRVLLDDQFVAIRKKQEELLQKIGLLQSPLIQAMEQQINLLEFSDLNTEESHTIIKLTLQTSTLDSLKQTLVEQSQNLLKDHYQQCNNGIDEVVKNINQELAVLAISPIPQIQFEDVNTLVDSLKQRLELNIRYRGEMPKRTIMTRLGESRKVIMGMSMAAMVLGGMAKALWGIELRNALAAIAPVLLIGGFAYTYVQWPKEDAERLTKELDRVHDTLSSEMKRLSSDVQRFIQQQIFEVLDEHKRQIQKAFQDQFQNHIEQAKLESDKQQRQQQIKLQQVDQSLRQWQTVERQLERLRSDAQALQRSF